MLKNSRTSGWIIGLLVLGAIAVLAFRGCSGVIPSTSSGNQGQPGSQQSSLGNMYVASQIDQNGCPINQETRFAPGDTIYVGTEPGDIPQGTAIFARLSRSGQPVEDTREITADSALRNTCAWFEFQSPRGLEPGSYDAELIVNGNRADRVQFVVEDSFGAAPGGANLNLGQFMATSRVDGNGCPTDLVDSYDPQDPIVVGLEESDIPAGTEIYARLVSDGQTIETTQPITADQDMRSCVWFQFDSDNRSGFDPGRYEAQIFVNGSRADRVDFIVR